MGADFLVVGLALKEGTEPDWEAGRAWIEAAPDDALESNVIPDPVEARQALRDSLATVERSIAEDWRTLNWVTVPGWKIYLTGGMSWGDSPDEPFDAFVDLVDMFPLARAVGFFWDGDGK